MDSFTFAPEIEQAMVSLCFYNPDRISVVMRELDPGVHFTQPHLRQILSAIDLAYRELGEHDFASVVTVLREQGQLNACGGSAGVNSVFEEFRYGFSSPQAEDEIFAHYIEMLKSYAIGRKTNEPVYRFNRGDIRLFPNKTKYSESAPDYVGEGKIAGRLYRAAEWINSGGHFLSLIPK
jgi:DnaB-like helicase N terminal domain